MMYLRCMSRLVPGTSGPTSELRPELPGICYQAKGDDEECETQNMNPAQYRMYDVATHHCHVAFAGRCATKKRACR